MAVIHRLGQARIAALSLVLVFAPAGHAQAPASAPAADQKSLAEFEFFKFREPLPRMTTFEDMLPLLPVNVLVDYGVMENWWYHAWLKGSDGVEYAFLHNWSHSKKSSGAAQFGELGSLTKPFSPKRARWTGEKIEVDLSGKTLSFEHSGPDARGRTWMTPPSTRVSFSYNDGTKLDLNFKGRGLPYFYRSIVSVKEKVYVSGFEDLSTVEGILETKGKKVVLKGSGVQERARWNWAAFPMDGSPGALAQDEYLPINFDQGYVLALRTKDIHGFESKSAAVSVNDQYWYVSDHEAEKISVNFVDESDLWPRQSLVRIDTAGGRLDITGDLRGTAMNFSGGGAGLQTSYPVYTFTGKFTYADGRVLPLTGGVGLVEHALRRNQRR